MVETALPGDLESVEKGNYYTRQDGAKIGAESARTEPRAALVTQYGVLILQHKRTSSEIGIKTSNVRQV